MDRVRPDQILDRIPNYKEGAKTVSRGIHDWVLEGGAPVRKLFDLLHGTWLGHPLHVVLTDWVIGAWIFAGVLDFMAAVSRRRSAEQAADTLTALGVAGAVPTALAGLADYTTISPRAMTTGATHGLMNVAGLLLNLISLADRKAGRRDRGVFFSSISLGIMTVSAWLGGELSFKYRVGVNKSPFPSGPQDWMPVMDEIELHEQQPLRLEVEGQPVLLYRYGGTVYAIGAVCGHDGAPLEEGKFDGLCVECPWHQSIYDLRDGSVVHGPTTYAEPSYAARIQDGKVELRLRDSTLKMAD
jgi:nitrite reductase/ring-hydroxylating ferredoxin subunit/uncharacterized membrane protein